VQVKKELKLCKPLSQSVTMLNALRMLLYCTIYISITSQYYMLYSLMPDAVSWA